MNKILTTAAGSSLGARSYESPALAIVEVHSEGVLCGSTMGADLSVEKWETDTFSWE